MIDPGPEEERHLRALRHELAEAARVVILLTHSHPDHAAAADRLSDETGWPVRGGEATAAVLNEGESFPTDAGEVVALHTPGHSRDHFAFSWPAARALFAGDLLLGEGSTTWVGEYSGCVADYLRSLERVRGLELDVVYPAHGPPIREIAGTLDDYEKHRRARIRQVEQVLAGGTRELSDVVRAVYGSNLPPELAGAARRSVEFTMEYLADR